MTRLDDLVFKLAFADASIARGRQLVTVQNCLMQRLLGVDTYEGEKLLQQLNISLQLMLRHRRQIIGLLDALPAFSHKQQIRL